MVRLSLPRLPDHLFHHSVGATATVIVWGLLGSALTALGGLTATRANGNRPRLALGMALTLAGVALVGSAVLYHNSLIQVLRPIRS